MKRFQQKGEQLFADQTKDVTSLDQVKELSFANCALSPTLVTSKFSQLKNLTRLTMVDMKSPLNSNMLAHILSAITNDAGNTCLYSLDVCDNNITSLLMSSFSSPDIKFPSLVRLIMANNKVASIEALGLSAERFPVLRTLDLDDNDEIPAEELKTLAFQKCPSLVVVNGKNREGKEFHDESDQDEDDDAFGDDEDDEGLGGEPGEEFIADYDQQEDVEEEEVNKKMSPSRREREE